MESWIVPGMYILVVIGILLIARDLIGWWTKMNTTVRLLEEIKEELKKQNK